MIAVRGRQRTKGVRKNAMIRKTAPKFKKETARKTHACCGVAATYQNREGARLAAGRHANAAAVLMSMAASHW